MKTTSLPTNAEGKSPRKKTTKIGGTLELVSKELNHLAAILHVYAGVLNFMK